MPPGVRRIVLPMDRSVVAECVLPHARALALALGAQISLIHVMPIPASTSRLDAVDPLEWRVRRAESETYLERVQSELEAAGIGVDAVVADGQPAEQIISFAHEKQADLILMSSHGQSGLSGWNVSSVVQKVLLRAYTSIMIVRAYQPLPEDSADLRYGHILVPLDGSPRAENVLPFVAELARAHTSRVVVAHVVTRPDMPRRTPLSREEVDLVEQIVERNRAEAARYLEEISGRLGESDVEPRLLISEQSCAAIALHQLAEQEKTDLVVLNAHGHTAETTWPYGSVVVSFLAYGSSPLLIIQDVAWSDATPTHAERALQQGGRR